MKFITALSVLLLAFGSLSFAVGSDDDEKKQKSMPCFWAMVKSGGSIYRLVHPFANEYGALDELIEFGKERLLLKNDSFF